MYVVVDSTIGGIIRNMTAIAESSKLTFILQLVKNEILILFLMCQQVTKSHSSHMRSLSFILTYGYSFLKSLLRIRGIRNISPPAMAPPIHFYNVNLIKPSSNKYFAGDLDYTYDI